MATIPLSKVLRLSNLSLILSGTLSVLGIFAFQAGWLNSEVNPSSSTVATLSSKQNDESEPFQEAFSNSVPGKVDMQIFAQRESPLLMQVFELNPVQKRIHSFSLMQP